MILKIEEGNLKAIESYHLPLFNEIPDVGLYLNQCATYINRALSPLFGISITESMISNYVKKKLIANPIKKQYSRENLAYLLFITLAKNAASLDDIQQLITIQKESYSTEIAYEYFRCEFEAILKQVFGIKADKADKGESESAEEELLRNIIVTIAHKIYIDMAFSVLRKENDQIC